MSKTITTGAISAAEGKQLDKEAVVSADERAQLARMADEMPDGEDQVLHRASLDETDEDGTPLEEKGLDQDLSGGDLDVPGAGDDDEENNEYSLGGDDHDDMVSDND
jgi:hypothetical protein